jgi:hypothetical protein
MGDCSLFELGHRHTMNLSYPFFAAVSFASSFTA